jgi:hypothetical protein
LAALCTQATVVVQPLSAISRRNSPKPISSSARHSVLVIRHGPGRAAARVGRAVATTGRGAMVIACGAGAVLHPDNNTSAVTKARACTVNPTLPAAILGGIAGGEQ